MISRNITFKHCEADKDIFATYVNIKYFRPLTFHNKQRTRKLQFIIVCYSKEKPITLIKTRFIKCNTTKNKLFGPTILDLGLG